MRGSRTPRKKELAFRAALLETGVVAHAARRAKLPVNTGYELAERAEADPEFVRARDAMHARVVPEVEAKLLALAESVTKRVQAPDLTPKQLAKLATANGLKSFSYQNPKPQYFRGLVDLYKGIVAARKGPEVTIPSSGSVTVNVRPTADAAERIAGDGGGSAGD